jgi:hypothetical protein
MLRIFVVTVALSLSSCPGAIGKALRTWGYTEVRPASTLWEPGSLVFVKHWQPFEVGTICDAKEVLGDDYKPRESLTMNSDMSRISKKGVTLDVDVANIVNTENLLNDMTDLKMTLNNGHIFEVTDYDIESRRGKTNPYCLSALAARQKEGYKITMIASALRADVSYNVSWDRNSKLSVAAKVQALANLSAHLGAEASPKTVNRIDGKGLYWGIRDDVYLAYRFLDPTTPPPVEPESRLIPTGLVVSSLKGADTTVAPPAAPSPTPAPSGPDASAQDGNGGRKTLSWRTEEGVHTYEMDADLPPPEYVLTPADPNEDWSKVVLAPKQEP